MVSSREGSPLGILVGIFGFCQGLRRSPLSVLYLGSLVEINRTDGAVLLNDMSTLEWLDGFNFSKP